MCADMLGVVVVFADMLTLSMYAETCCLCVRIHAAAVRKLP